MKFHRILPALFAMALFSCHNAAESTHHHDHDHDHESEGIHEHSEDHEHGDHAHDADDHDGLIEFSDAEASRFNVGIALPSQGEIIHSVKLPGVLTGNTGSQAEIVATKSGRISLSLREGGQLKAGQTVGSVKSDGVTGGDTDAGLRARLSALESELKRIEPLVAEGIVSRKDYNSLQAEIGELRQLVRSSGGASSLSSPVAGVVTQILKPTGSFVSAGEPVALVRPASGGSLLLRVDIPQRLAGSLNSVRSASVIAPGGRTLTLPRASIASTSDNGGYITAFFGPVTADGLIAGTALEASLALNSSSAQLTLPAASINEQEGVYSVFVKVSPGHYRRTIVNIGRTDDSRVEIVGGLEPTDSVVSRGTVFIRLAETRANAPQGHTHNH